MCVHMYFICEAIFTTLQLTFCCIVRFICCLLASGIPCDFAQFQPNLFLLFSNCAKFFKLSLCTVVAAGFSVLFGFFLFFFFFCSLLSCVLPATEHRAQRWKNWSSSSTRKRTQITRRIATAARHGRQQPVWAANGLRLHHKEHTHTYTHTL